MWSDRNNLEVQKLHITALTTMTRNSDVFEVQRRNFVGKQGTPSDIICYGKIWISTKQDFFSKQKFELWKITDLVENKLFRTCQVTHIFLIKNIFSQLFVKKGHSCAICVTSF